MDIDPHTLQEIIQRIYQQMRCPQCGKRVPVDFTSVRVASDDFMLLQLRCDACDAYIVLHAALKGVENLCIQDLPEGMVNASSTLNLKDGEVDLLRKALEESDGSFEQVFQKYGAGIEMEGDSDVNTDKGRTEII